MLSMRCKTRSFIYKRAVCGMKHRVKGSLGVKLCPLKKVSLMLASLTVADAFPLQIKEKQKPRVKSTVPM